MYSLKSVQFKPMNIVNMELCVVCDIQAVNQCTTCRVFLCKEHKRSHESKKGAHKFGIVLTSEERKIILEDLSSKSKMAYECQTIILKSTNELIERIQGKCREALGVVNKLCQKYEKLLINYQNTISKKQMEEAEKQLNITLEIYLPQLDFKEIENFYKVDFLKESLRSQRNPHWTNFNQRHSDILPGSTSSNQRFDAHNFNKRPPNSTNLTTKPTYATSYMNYPSNGKKKDNIPNSRPRYPKSDQLHANLQSFNQKLPDSPNLNQMAANLSILKPDSPEGNFTQKAYDSELNSNAASFMPSFDSLMEHAYYIKKGLQ